MSAGTNIEWTDRTHNVVTGCTRISPGCTHCYAERLAATRLKHKTRFKDLAVMRGKPGEQEAHWTNVVKVWEEQLPEILTWRKPQRVFINSCSDTFHKDVPFDFLDKLFAVMACCPHITFQLLTKRADRMLEYLTTGGEWSESRRTMIDLAMTGEDLFPHVEKHFDRDKVQFDWPLPNVWLGVSVEDQQRADERIPLLLQCPAAVRFLSCEPLLSPVLLYYIDEDECALRGPAVIRSGGMTASTPDSPPEGFDDSQVGIDWVICGGESGKGARPMHLDWARSLRNQCRDADIPFFFKQTGAWTEVPESEGKRGDQFLICREYLAHGDKPRRFEWKLYPWRFDDPPMAGAKAGRWSPWRDALMRPIGGHGGELDQIPEDLHVREFPVIGGIK